MKTDDEIRADFECQICFDVGAVVEPYENGTGRTRAVPCICRTAKIRKARFEAAVNLTPSLYRDRHMVYDGLNAIEDRPQAHPKQPEVLAKLRKRIQTHPNQSYFFFGRTGAHKTTFAWALVQEAGRLGKLVGGNTGKSLIDTLRNYAIHQRMPARGISFYALEQLETEPGRFCVLIDDIDGIIISEYTFGLLWDLLDKVQTYEQQLIITSNKAIRPMLSDWMSRDDGRANSVNYSEKLIRRMSEICLDIDLT